MMKLGGTVSVIAVICALAGGCAESPSDEISDEINDEMSTLTASSATTADTGVATWGTYEDAEGRWVIGLAADGSKVGTLLADVSDDDTLRFVGQPGGEQVQLSRDGKLAGGEGTMAHRLVAALHADTRKAWFSRPGGESASTTGTVTQALTSLNSQEDFKCNGLGGGQCGDFDAGGGWCRNGAPRAYYNSYVTAGSGSCWIERWINDDPFHCGIRVHTATTWFGSVTCRAQTYVNL
jgi:hypothetical protein